MYKESYIIYKTNHPEKQGDLFNNINNSRYKNSKMILKKLDEENKIHYRNRAKLSSHIKILKSWIIIWNIFWSFDLIYFDSFNKGEKELRKSKYTLPKIQDIDFCASFLPWENIQEKRFNLALLLWFEEENFMNLKIWIKKLKVFEILNLH